MLVLAFGLLIAFSHLEFGCLERFEFKEEVLVQQSLTRTAQKWWSEESLNGKKEHIECYGWT